MAKLITFKKGRFRRRKRLPPPRPRIVLLLIVGTVIAATYWSRLAPVASQVKDFSISRTLQSLSPKAPLPPSVVGLASVIDGDTIEIHGTRIRFYGIDAPESNQICFANGKTNRCGQRAALKLADEIGNHVVSCDPKDRDGYGRIVAVCRANDADLNAWMVRNGWALAYRRYSGAYIPEEDQAKKAKAGIWQGNFAPPWDWRHGRANSQAVPLIQTNSRTTGQCLIKGNINRRGHHIYHVPGQEYYDRTVISPWKGERWFCTEAEARAAGWRKSMR